MRHPLHPPTVHFPIACWLIAVGADIAGLYLGMPAWRFAAALLAIGSVMALFSVVTGLIEATKVPEDGPMPTVWLHMGAMSAALIAACISLFLHLDGKEVVAISWSTYLVDAILVACVSLGGFLGGELVFRHGVGQNNR